MSILANSAVIGGGTSGIDTGDIQNSLRFRSAASAYLSRTFGAGSQKKWTWSGWIKRGVISAASNMHLFGLGGFNGSNQTVIYLLTNNIFGVTHTDSSSVIIASRNTSAVFRDHLSHFHAMVVWDTDNAVAADRIILYVHGIRITDFTSSIDPALGLAGWISSAQGHTIGRYNFSSDNPFDGYLSRVCFVDGQALTPDSFGYLNAEINEWVSKTQSEVKAVVDAGGTNSFMLDFDDATSLTTLGYDKSAKGNNWTCNNISLTAGVTYDHMLDVPGNSYAVLNNIFPSAANISWANLRSGTTAARGTIPCTDFNSYWEVTAGASNVTAGVIDAAASANTTTVTANKVFAFEMTTAGTIKYRNVTDSGAWTDITTGLSGARWPYGITAAADWNFGQRPFIGTPETGFKALCQRNLPDIDPATLLDPTDHHIDITVTKSGDTNFTLPWNATTYDTFFEIKRRDAAGDWYQIDGLRGYDKILKSNSTAAETTDANVLGVSGTTCTLRSTLPNGTYVISATKAGLSASRQTNTDGTITSTVSRNVDSGFSIVIYTANDLASQSVGHGLTRAPATLMVKNRTGIARSWAVQHRSIPATHYLLLDTTGAQSSAGTYPMWGDQYASSTVIFLDRNSTVNETGSTYVAYCFAEVPGFSRIGSYTGNGSADGPFVYCGFRPRWVMVKLSSSAGGNWIVVDAARSPSNVSVNNLFPNSSSAEVSAGNFSLDLTANGFKIRTANAQSNNSGSTYIFLAFAESPFNYSRAR